MKLEKINLDTIKKILASYDKHIGRFVFDYYFEHPESLLEDLKNALPKEDGIIYYRIGSRWTDDSKLGFDLDYNHYVKVFFNLNYHGIDGKRVEKDAEIAEKKFLKEIKEILR